MTINKGSYHGMCKEIAELCGCYFADQTFKSGVMDDCEVINPKELQESIADILTNYNWKYEDDK